VLNFSSLPVSLGYWTGSLLLPLILTATPSALRLRGRSLAGELVLLQMAWAAAAVGLAWLPLLDLSQGHLGRWLELWRLPAAALWVGPALAVPLAAPPCLRLLALARVARPDTGRMRRLATVLLHLGLPCVAWCLLATLLRTSLPWPAVSGLAAPLVAALVVAWFRYPPVFAHRLEGLTAGGWLRLIPVALALGLLLWGAGRPLPDQRSGGVLWAAPGSFNNIRPWIEPDQLAELW
jgi:hypothetical protein